MNTLRKEKIVFPEFSGIRCLMMPYVQGNPASVPDIYEPYRHIIEMLCLTRGDIGFLTIDESPATAGTPHRGARAKHGRAIHTEAGKDPDRIYCWGGDTGWGKPPHRVTLDRTTKILLANNLDNSCALWEVEHEDTSSDGDIGHVADQYPYSSAVFMKAGEVHEIGILTPHESLPVPRNCNRQFLRIVSSGVHGREDYFTRNPLVAFG